MDLGQPALLEMKLRLLASDVVRAQALTGWFPDMRDAIELATELLVADRDTPATLEVAQLSPGTSFAESRDLVCSMLAEQGIDPSDLSGADAYEVQLDAFAAGLLDASAIEGPFYDQLAAWDSQPPLDQVLVRLFDERDRFTDPASQAAIEARMREAIRDARSQ